MSIEPKICEPGGRGLLFPLFEAEQTWHGGARAVVYALALFYLFYGVNIVSDKFMSAIEAITSKTQRVRDRRTGKVVTVAVWNATVANLTLMALGSSAPEILLSVIEIVANDFHSGDLGPSTIVGSAAFNLFMIIAVCIMAIPSPDTRKIKEDKVFLITAAFSLFAYAWLVFICQWSSPNVVDIWEAVVTLALLPVLVGVSYLADAGYLTGGRKPAVEPPRTLGILEDTASPSFFDDGSVRDGSEGLRQQTGALEQHAPAGILAFPSDTWELSNGLEERLVYIPVLRHGGREGAVSCKYRFEGRTAVPGYDYVAQDGALEFGPGEDRAHVPVKLLPKRLGEHSDEFLVLLEGADGGAVFDPRSDGGEERCVLTITIHNASDDLARGSAVLRASRWVDRAVNVDALRLSAATWCEDLRGAVTEVAEEGEAPSSSDWVLHLLGLPWKVLFAIFVPPATLAGGWPCFCMSLAFIGGVTAWIIDFAELFGCVTNIEDSITAITFVALGTSMPDLFASRTAAVQDHTADASIVNVTGSNSVNVFLGIGLPWTIASIYWWSVGATEEWKSLYGDVAGLYPGGAFVVRSGDLSFSVVVFTVAAFVALVLLRFRRHRLGGELGGEWLPKTMSSSLLTLLWVFYLALSIWKVTVGDVGVGAQVMAIAVAVCILENVLLVLGCGLYFLSRRGPPEEDEELGNAEEGRADSSEVMSLPPTLLTTRHLEHGPMAQAYKADGPLTASGCLRHAAVAATWDGQHPPVAVAGDAAATEYGCRSPGPVRCVLSFTHAAMVCLAAQRFKSLERESRLREAMRPFGPEEAPAMRREASFHSMAEDASRATTPREPQVGGVGGSVAGYVRRHAADWMALSAAGLAAAHLAADPQGAAAF